MFSRSSFSTTSFSARSWRFPVEILDEAPAPAGGVGTRRGADDDLEDHVRASWDLLEAKLAAQARATSPAPPAADPQTQPSSAPVAPLAAPPAAAPAQVAQVAHAEPIAAPDLPDPAMLAAVRAAEEAALLALLLQVEATTWEIRPAPTDDELLLVAALAATIH